MSRQQSYGSRENGLGHPPRRRAWVDGERVTVNKFDTTRTLASVTNDYDLDGLFASRLQREGGRAVYRIAEASLDMARGDPLRDAVSLIGPAAAVQPTQGISMIQVD